MVVSVKLGNYVQINGFLDAYFDPHYKPKNYDKEVWPSLRMLFRKEHLQASCRVKDSKIVWGGGVMDYMKRKNCKNEYEKQVRKIIFIERWKFKFLTKKKMQEK